MSRTPLRHCTDRRTVLKTTGGFLAGATMFTGTGGADEASPLLIDVRQEALNPDENGDIPVEVTIPEDLLDPGPAFPLSPSDILFGVGQAFETMEEGGQEFVTITDEFENGVATPEEILDFGNPHEWPKRYLMTFATGDLYFPSPENLDGTLGLGLFPDGVDDIVPVDQWDTDTVRFVGGGRGTGKASY